MLSSFFKVNIDFPQFRDVTDWFVNYLQSLIMPRTGLTKFFINQISEGAIQKEKLVQIVKQADFFISDIKLKTEEKDIPNDVISFLSNIEELPNELKTKIHSEQRLKSIDLSFEHENEHGERYDIPFKFESMGTQRFFGLAGILYLMLKDSSLFPIDALESSLHPDLFEYFVLTFLKNAKQSQCLVTTHNREILNNRDLFRNDAVWIVDKSLSSSAELYS